MLSGEGVHNGEAYVATLPGRQILDPSLVPSGTHLWWSGSGNDFGCSPDAGHNLDLALPAVPAGTSEADADSSSRAGTSSGTSTTASSSRRTDNGKTYKSYPSAKGYTTEAAQNPNANGCQSSYGNGLTGSSGSYAAGSQAVDRLTGTYPAAPFVDDEYDITDLIGKPGAVLRFSYATDPGLARPGWFMDDVEIKADDTVIYSSDFETRGRRGAVQRRLPRDAGHRTALHDRLALRRRRRGLPGRARVPAGDARPLRLRRARPGRVRPRRPHVRPGVLLAYTDEDHGYGNVGTDNPPAQTPLDSRPEPGSDTPNLDDAAFKAGDAFSDGGAGHADNYTDANGDPWVLKYGCLAFTVDRLAGTAVGPEVAGAYDLAGDVKFTTTATCGSFDYGNGAVGEGQPVQPPVTPPAQERKPSAAAPPVAAPPAATGTTTKKAAVCKARGVRARGALRSFRTSRARRSGPRR